MIDIYKRVNEAEMTAKDSRENMYRDKSRKALKKIINKRCTTIFIGALDSIEQQLGDLWGSDKSYNDLTEKEKVFLGLWKKLRREILDKGNAQAKILLSEIDFFEILLKNYYYDITSEQ